MRSSFAPCFGLTLAFVSVAACGLTGSHQPDHVDGDAETGSADSSTSEVDASSTEGASETTGEDTSTELPLDCAGTSLRLATFNLYEVGTVGSDAYQAAVAILLRIDADIVCLQEVLYYEGPALAALAADAGYTDVVQADRAPAIGGPLTNACLARVPLDRIASYTASELSPDPGANDVGRDILAVRAHLHDSCRVGVLNVHLKAGRNETDRFRRQVEVERLLQASDRYRDQRVGEPVFALGDFNERIDASELGQLFSSVPNDLPQSYRLGTDVVLPLRYHPFERMQDGGFSVGEPLQAGTDRPYTWDDTSRLDYLFWSGAELLADEVYYACRDEDTGGIDKAGAPLDCSVSAAASDHFPVVADFALH